jgi:hypothetical protein
MTNVLYRGECESGIIHMQSMPLSQYQRRGKRYIYPALCKCGINSPNVFGPGHIVQMASVQVVECIPDSKEAS